MVQKVEWRREISKHAHGLPIIQRPQSRTRTESKINSQNLSQIYACMYEAFKVHQSHQIKEQFRNVN